MKRNNFFANAASKALALAAAVMMSAAFAACSSSNNDDDGGGGIPPSPEPKAQTVTLDGEEKPILEAGYEDKGNGNYKLYLNLSADGKERVTICLNKDLHMTGSPIDLTKKEETHTGKEWYWEVIYSDHGKGLFDTWGALGSPITLFITGTLTVSGSPDGTINIRLENGRVKDTDGKEHTLTVSYSGTMTEEYVDLGLSVKWARCNLGASKPSDYGDYFAWGETEPNKAEYTWATYKWKYITKYTYADGQTKNIWYDAGGNFIGDNKTTLEAADDAATANLGSPWYMPTGDEFQELLDNCTWTWTTQDGVKGYEVKSKKNGNSIFLPAAGRRTVSELKDAGSEGDYWSSSLRSAYLSSEYARDLYFDADLHKWDSDFRYSGLSVRPVRP